jgi:ubiquinone/menaquinone biosynthesis C-methylase UbiE
MTRRGSDAGVSDGLDPATERARDVWDRNAERYDAGERLDRWLLQDARAWATSQSRGDVLEIGIGTGANLQYYGRDVRLVGIDLSPNMLARARVKAETLTIDVRLEVGDAQQLPFAGESFDSVVCTLVLCSVPDDRRAIGEVFRVLRPRGRFILVEHVRSPNLVVQAIERLVDPIVSRSGDHQLRDPLDHLARAGFVVEHVKRTRLGYIERTIARRP